MPTRAPVLLLPPSEGKEVGGDDVWDPGAGAFAELDSLRLVVAAAYRSALDGPDAAKVVGADGPLLERARAAAAVLDDGRAPAMPAHRRFSGVVWEHLRPATLDADALERIAVPNGLCGIVAATDLVPDFRLKLSVRLDGVGRLDGFWQPPVTAALERWADGRQVWDLLPAEHRRAVSLEPLDDVVQVRFVGPDGASAAGHAAKAAKGLLASYVLRKGDVAGARIPGWQVRRRDDVVTVRMRPAGR